MSPTAATTDWIGVGGTRMGNGRFAGLLAAALAGGCYGGMEPAAGSSDESGAGTTGVAPSTATGSEPGEGSTGADVDTGDIDEVEVPSDLPVLTWAATCHAIDPGATVSAAPDGALWIAQDDGAWTVADPLGRNVRQDPGMVGETLRAWSRARAFLHRDGGLFEVDAEWSTPMLWPTTSPAIEASCGDPTTDGNGFVVASGLHQRDGGQWWRWSAPAGSELDDVAWFATMAGGCVDADGAAWLGTSEGHAWRVRADRLDRVSAIDGATAAVIVDDRGTAALVEGAIVVGSPELGWERHRFAAGPVVAIGASPGVLWAMVGDTIHRFAEGEWSRLDHLAVPHTIVGDGGGVWAIGEHEACHLHEATPLVLSGVHHLQRIAADTAVLEIEGEAAAMPVAWLDARPLDVTTIEEHDGVARWRVPLAVAERGWHELRLVWTTGGALRERTLRIERRGFAGLTWDEDIEPLFAEHCAGSDCHGPDLAGTTRPDLSTEAAWLERKSAILERVSVEADMPPVGARGETWDHDVALMIFEWLDAQQGG